MRGAPGFASCVVVFVAGEGEIGHGASSSAGDAGAAGTEGLPHVRSGVGITVGGGRGGERVRRSGI